MKVEQKGRVALTTLPITNLPKPRQHPKEQNCRVHQYCHKLMNKMEVAESEERYIREAQLCTFTSIKIINENGKEDIPFIKTVGS